MLNPGIPAAPLPPVALVPEGPGEDAPEVGAMMAEAGGVTDGVTSHVLSLWIDLVRQAGSVAPAAPGSAADGLTRQQLRALGCLEDEGLTMRALARSLGISSAAATSIADRLTEVGATVRYRDSLDRRLVHLVATGAGVQMARDYRCGLVAVLERLLDQMEPGRLAVLTLAMKELAGGMNSPSCASPYKVLTPEPQRWTLN